MAVGKWLADPGGWQPLVGGRWLAVPGGWQLVDGPCWAADGGRQMISNIKWATGNSGE